MLRRGTHHELNEWLDRHGYRHAHARRTATTHPYIASPHRGSAHARMIHQEPTGREVFAVHERDHHITTSGRRALDASQFALPPGPEEKRRGIRGRLPIDTLGRARSALARASMMHHEGHLTAGQLAAVRGKVHHAWPSIRVEAHARRVPQPYIPDGRSRGWQPGEFDPVQLAHGTEHEMEHTTSR